MHYRNLAVAIALTGASALPALAETVKTAGTVCWTGDIDYIGTSEKDTAWIWNIDWTFTPANGELADATWGKCFGSGGLIDGSPDVATQFCLNITQDGGKYLSHAKAGPEGAKGTYFGGTDKYAGITGGWEGGKITEFSAGDGKLAGCRPVTGEYTLAE